MSRIYGVLALLLVSVVALVEPKVAEVRFVNVVFRHGDRAPDDNGKELYPNDPYLHGSFYPMGLGGLTNNGKRREFQLGETLRNRYNDFLGEVYTPDDIVARSTDYKRTKMSLHLVLASLYPPATVQRWHPRLNWQPIPTTYQPSSLDVLLIPEECPKYLQELSRVLALPEVVEKVETFRPFMNSLTVLTGKPITTTNDMYYLYHNLMAERSMDLVLPEWTNEIFPRGKLLDGTNLEYDIVSHNNLLKRLNGGALLKRFTEDMVAAVDGTAKVAKKMNLFSGHETNVAALLQTLGVYTPHVPEYSSAVFVELVKIDGGHYVKVLYYHGIPSTVEELTIPGCESLCPLNDFRRLLENVTPTSEDLVCQKSAPPPQASR